MPLRAFLVVVAALVGAACSAGGRGAGDLGAAGAPPACPTYPHGAVTLFRSTASTSMLALFQKSSSRTCMTASAASCSALIYSALPADAGVPVLTDAGALSVAGGAMPVTQSPSPNGGYPTLRVDSLLWSGGESMTLSAAGGEVPAFTAMTVAPSAATLTMPSARPTTIARGTDLTLSWSGGGVGLVEVLMSASATGTPAVEIHCRFPLGAGQGVVPAAILGNLPAGSMGSLIMTTMTPQTVQAGDWSVDVALGSVAVDQAGDGVATPVVFN